MPGGLMQLVAYGAQDLYLTSNPQVTFFKVVYRRHTNFATESVEQPFSGTADFGRKVTCEIQRAGDLITKMYVRAILPAFTYVGTSTPTAQWAWTSKIGHALLESIELNIGGVQIDKQYGDWLNIWYDLARNFAQDRGYDHMIGNTYELTTLASSHPQTTLWIPLKFACCRNDGLAIPVIALQYHDIRINIEFKNATRLVVKRNDGSPAPSLHLVESSLYVDFVYLDNDERKRFAQASHEYLFEQLQYTGDESVVSAHSKYRLNLNHPCKELIWVARNTKYTSGTSAFLAWSPHNWEAARVQATKRFVLRLASYVAGTGFLTGSGPAITYGAAGAPTYLNSLGQNVVAIFAAVNPVAIDFLVVPTVDLVTVLGRLLTDEEMSASTDVLFGGVTLNANIAAAHPVLSDGDPSEDLLVAQHDNYGVYINGHGNPTLWALLQLNGQDRFSSREGMYFNYVQPYQCHTNTPVDGVNVYSFALEPEEHQPSGSCNMSRIDNATLNLTFDPSFTNTNSAISIYATNYNVLRILSGMGGLAYSN